MCEIKLTDYKIYANIASGSCFQCWERLLNALGQILHWTFHDTRCVPSSLSAMAPPTIPTSQWGHPLKILQSLWVEAPICRWGHQSQQWWESLDNVIASTSMGKRYMAQPGQMDCLMGMGHWWVPDLAEHWPLLAFTVKVHFLGKFCMTKVFYIDLGIKPTEHSGLYFWLKMHKLSVSELYICTAGFRQAASNQLACGMFFWWFIRAGD